MLQKKQNNTISAKLDALQQLPAGMEFDAAAGWKNLETSLLVHPKKKHPWRIYAAALVLVSLASWLLLQQQGSRLLSPVAKVKMMPLQQLRANQLQTTINAVSPQQAAQLPVVAEKKLLPNTQTQPLTTTINQSTIKPVPVPEQSFSSQLNKQELTPEEKLLPPVNKSEAVVSLPAKKKIRVIHLNEMGQPVPAEEPKEPELSSMYIFSKPIANTEQPTNTEEENTSSPKKKSLLKTNTGLQNNN